jgi:hypothetical protein
MSRDLVDERPTRRRTSPAGAVPGMAAAPGWDRRGATTDGHPFRRTFVIAESVICLSGAMGTWQLLTDTFTPDVTALEPLGLKTWTLPGVWLFATAAAPAGAAAWLAYRRSDRAPAAVLVANGLLAVELLVQMPFLGLSPLQAIYGAPAAGLAALALRARTSGWSRHA